MKNFYFITPILTIILAALNISLASDNLDDINPEKSNPSHLSTPITEVADDEVGDGQLQQVMVQRPQMTFIQQNQSTRYRDENIYDQLQQSIVWRPQETAIRYNQWDKYSNLMLTSRSGGGGWPPELDDLIFKLPSLTFQSVDLSFPDYFHFYDNDKAKRRMVLRRFKLLLEKNEVANLGASKVINQDKMRENPLWPELPYELKNVILSFLKPSALWTFRLVSHASYDLVLHLDRGPFLTPNIHPKVFLVNQDKVDENPLWPILNRDAKNLILDLMKIADLKVLRQVNHASYEIVSYRLLPFLKTHILNWIISAHALNKSRKNAAIDQPEEQKYIDVLMRQSLRHNPTPVNALYGFYDIMECSSFVFEKCYKKYSTLTYSIFKKRKLVFTDLESITTMHNFLNPIKYLLDDIKLQDIKLQDIKLQDIKWQYLEFNSDYSPAPKEGYEQIVPSQNVLAKPSRSHRGCLL